MKILKRIILALVLLIIGAAIIFVVLGYINYVKVIDEISIKDKIASIKANSNYVTFDNINEDLLNATVAIEDRRFYEHGAVDYIGMSRAFVSNIFAKEIVGGGSTITQQLAKNLYFSYNPSFVRKVSEIFVAYDLEGELTKQEILELYVNVINYGDNYIGVAQASLGYYNKSPMDLTLDEASCLAGIPQSPSNFQLSNHKENALVRQKQVLKAMLRDAYITKEQVELLEN